MSQPKVSIIIPDDPMDETFPYDNVKIIPSGKVGPAEKRDMALTHAEVHVALRVSMVTTWNSKCGIAEYTKMEVEATQSHINY